MKIISQLSMFDETENELFEGDLSRLKAVLENLPDEKLIQKLNHIRGNGRDDWPVYAMWNSFVASFIFDHESVKSLIRELNRNSQLRDICGFKPHTVRMNDGNTKIVVAPSESAYSKFIKNLVTHCNDEISDMFQSLVDYMYENLDGFGECLMVDGKAIQSFATKTSTSNNSGNRGEHDADWCCKTYSSSTPTGERITKKVSWFGFRLHLIADADYELPVAFKVTKASESEKTVTHNMLNEEKDNHKDRIDKCEFMLGDRGYDSTALIEWLEDQEIKPIIDICNHWKDGEETKQYRDTDLVYNYRGDVWYVDDNGKKIKLQYKGYDAGTDSLRYGFKPQENDNRQFRIKCSEDRRIFCPVARDSMKWQRIYNKRSGIERINGRIDRDYEFERHTIRGLDKMNMFISVTMIIYLAVAKVKIEVGQTEHLCSLYA